MGNKDIKKVISWLLLMSIFITGNGLAKIGFTLEWFHLVYIPFLILCLILYHRFSIKIAIALILLCVWSLLTFKYGFPLVVKQLFNVILSVFVFYNYLLWENFDFREVFRKYIALSKIVLLIGFFQVIIFALEPYGVPAHFIYYTIFPWLRDATLSIRFQSVTQEPSYLAYAFGPIVFLGLYNLFYRKTIMLTKWWSVLFIAAYVFTFSLVAYTGLVLMILVIYFRNFTVQKLSVSVFIFAAIASLGYLAYEKVEEIKIRTDDTVKGFGKDITDWKVYKSVNLTTYVLLAHGWVTEQSLRVQPILGSGFGTYELTYDSYLPADMKAYSKLNREDAGSMGLRLFTETGILGFSIFCFLTVHFKLSFKPEYNYDEEFFWILNAGIFCLIILFLIRSGNYTHQGRMLFYLIYYYTYKAVHK